MTVGELKSMLESYSDDQLVLIAEGFVTYIDIEDVGESIVGYMGDQGWVMGIGTEPQAAVILEPPFSIELVEE